MVCHLAMAPGARFFKIIYADTMAIKCDAGGWSRLAPPSRARRTVGLSCTDSASPPPTIGPCRPGILKAARCARDPKPHPVGDRPRLGRAGSRYTSAAVGRAICPLGCWSGGPGRARKFTREIEGVVFLFCQSLVRRLTSTGPHRTVHNAAVGVRLSDV
jgi:hypothetical protein